MMQAPPMVDEDEQLPYDSREGEPILLPPHIYYYELVPDENYSLDYDNGKHYLPPYDPNAPKVEGKFTPKDYAGEMPPVGDKGGGEEFDDYMSYAPPVGQVPPVGEAPSTKDIRRNPMLFQKATPELIPDIPYWLDFTGKGFRPTAQRNILNDLFALGRTI